MAPGEVFPGELRLDEGRASVMIPGPRSHRAKVAFEKYFLWKMREGHVHLP